MVEKPVGPQAHFVAGRWRSAAHDARLRRERVRTVTTISWYIGAFMLAWALGFVIGQKVRMIMLAVYAST
jgi:hypothetical protein